MSRWFRHYAGMMRDEKLVAVAVRTKQPVERVVWVWGAILESAAEIDDGGRYELDGAEVAYFLRADEADILAVETGLAAAGRVAEGIVVKWSDRQYQSDKSVARQAAYRERKRAERSHADTESEPRDVTPSSPQRHVTPQDTEADTDTDTDTEAERADARAEGHREVADQILKATDFPLSSWEDGFLCTVAATSKLSTDQQSSFDAIASRWRNKQPNAPPPPPQCALVEGSEAWAAWQRVKGKRLPVTDLKDDRGNAIGKRGWYFPTEFPDQKGAAE